MNCGKYATLSGKLTMQTNNQKGQGLALNSWQGYASLLAEFSNIEDKLAIQAEMDEISKGLEWLARVEPDAKRWVYCIRTGQPFAVLTPFTQGQDVASITPQWVMRGERDFKARLEDSPIASLGFIFSEIVERVVIADELESPVDFLTRKQKIKSAFYLSLIAAGDDLTVFNYNALLSALSHGLDLARMDIPKTHKLGKVIPMLRKLVLFAGEAEASFKAYSRLAPALVYGTVTGQAMPKASGDVETLIATSWRNAIASLRSEGMGVGYLTRIAQDRAKAGVPKSKTASEAYRRNKEDKSMANSAIEELKELF